MSSPSLTISFPGPSLSSTGSLQPDCSIAAGISHVVTVEQARIQWYDKAGTLQSDQSLFAFFNNPATQVIGDARVVYDDVNNRFVAIADGWDAGKIYVAVSKDSDPSHGWNYATIDAGQVVNGQYSWVDAPAVSTDGEAVYITGRMISFGSDGMINTSDDVFQESRLWIVNDGNGTGGLYDGGPMRVSEFGANVVTGGATPSFGRPAQMLSPATGALGTFLVSVTAGGRVQIVRVDDPTTSPSFHFQTLMGVPSGPFSAQAGQPNTSAGLEVHTAGNVVWRDGALYTVAVIGPTSGPDAGVATAHWYKISTDNLDALTILDQGDVSGAAFGVGPGVATFQPSIAVNGNGDFLVNFSASGPGLYAGAYYALHAVDDAPGTLQGYQALRFGEDAYELQSPIGTYKWGDNSGIAVDPVDDLTFWVFNQYAALRGFGQAGNWGTQIGAVPAVLKNLTLTGFGGFDTNGRADLAFSSDGLAALWLSGSTGFFEFIVLNARMGAEWKAADTGDFNGDGLSDFLWTQSTGDAAIWLLNGSRLTQFGIPAGRMGAEWQLAGVGDLNGDRKADIVWGNNSGQAAVWSMDGTTLGSVGFSNGRMGAEWSITTLGDFNADAKRDLLWISSNGGVIEWLMNGSDVVGAIDVGHIGGEWHVGGTGDVNGDSASDIVWLDNDNNVQVWTMSAGRVTQFIPLSGRNGLEWTLAAVADFTGDRKADLLWLTGGGLAQVWSLNGPQVIFSQMTTPRDFAPSNSFAFAAPTSGASAPTLPGTGFEDVVAPEINWPNGEPTWANPTSDVGAGYGSLADEVLLGQSGVFGPNLYPQ